MAARVPRPAAGISGPSSGAASSGTVPRASAFVATERSSAKATLPPARCVWKVQSCLQHGKGTSTDQPQALQAEHQCIACARFTISRHFLCWHQLAPADLLHTLCHLI